MTDAGTKRGLNNEDLELELEINSDLRLSNRNVMKKSGSLGHSENNINIYISK